MEKEKFTKGYAYAFFTMIIWTGWMIFSRLGTKHSLTPFDITFFRFAPAGLLMLPVAIKNRKLINKQTAKGIFIMLLGAGPLYLLATSSGFKLAPASHGVLTPCSMTLFVAMLTYFFLREKITKVRFAGYMFIFTGVVFKFIISHGSLADCYFLIGGFLWAVYTIQNKKSGLSPLVVTSFVTVGGTLFLIIPYSIYLFYNPHPMATDALLQQIIYQGFFTAIVSFITYNRAVALIGAGRASSFAALIPVMVTLASIPLLGEYPDSNDMVFAALMSAGVFLASGVVKFADRSIKA